MSTSLLSILLDDRALDLLKSMQASGLYGEDVPQVAETLILEGLREAVGKGILTIMPSGPVTPDEVRRALFPAPEPSEDALMLVRRAFQEVETPVRMPSSCWHCEDGRLNLADDCIVCGRRAVGPPKSVEEPAMIDEPQPPAHKPDIHCELCDNGRFASNGDPCDACGRDIEIPF